MTITPQTNATLEEIAEAILKEDSLCICGHVSPDGDCIGSGLALRNALVQIGREPVMLLADAKGELGDEFRFLPGAEDYIHAADYKGTPDLFIAVDVPNPERLGHDGAKVQARAKKTITIDHHAVDTRMSHLSYTDPDAASTTMIVWEMVKHLGVALDKAVATCALSGLMTDTGSFRYQNADAAAFAAAAEMVAAGAEPAIIATQFFQRRSLASIHLEARTIEHLEFLDEDQVALSWVSKIDLQETGGTKADCEPLVNTLRSIDGVRVACMLREQGDGVRGSLRSKDDTDISPIARHFGGGGHKAASGFTLHCSLGEAIETMRKTLNGLFGETGVSA